MGTQGAPRHTNFLEEFQDQNGQHIILIHIVDTSNLTEPNTNRYTLYFWTHVCLWIEQIRQPKSWDNNATGNQ